MIYKSRCGHHPCNHETFLKLKKVHKAYSESRRLLAKHRRWSTKLPQNRVGPEPVVPEVLRQICASNIVVEFDTARHAVPEPDQVTPLGISAAQLDRWVAQLDAAEVV